MMGWISWNVVQDKISTQVVKTVADNMVNLGLRDAGYDFIIIDDLWHAPQRNSDGTPKEDPAKFPIGMGATVKYVHDQGLKFGHLFGCSPQNVCRRLRLVRPTKTSTRNNTLMGGRPLEI